MESKPMLEKRTWREFQDSGLLWFINRTLHLFGWAIVIEQDAMQQITTAHPARCHFRGFFESDEEKGFKKVTKHMKDNIEDWEKDL